MNPNRLTTDDMRCPVRLPAEEGQYSRRCHYIVWGDCICPIHGDVTIYLKRYHKSKSLIDANSLEKAKKEEPKRTWLGQFFYDVFK